MMTISDHIFERSVTKQLKLEGKKKEFFSENGSEANMIFSEDAGILYAEASSLLFFDKHEEILTSEHLLLPLKRKLMCKGAELSHLRVEFTFMGKFVEAKLRAACHSLGEICEKEEIVLHGVGVHKLEGGSGILLHLIGSGQIKSLKEAPWQKQMLFSGQGIVITGSIGRAGSLTLFHKEKEKVEQAFPKVFVDKIRRRVPDRLPYIELEMASFFGVTALMYGEEGGLLAALYRLGNREAGFQIYGDRLSYDQETIEMAEIFNKNPLELSSEGVYVMAANRAEDFVASLRAAGLPAVLAGGVTEEKKRVILFGEEERFIESPRF